jgi:uncharacterized protein
LLPEEKTFQLWRPVSQVAKGMIGSNCLTSAPPESLSDLHVLVKPAGSICNLDCKYCYFLSKEMLYPGSQSQMADELLESYIRQTIEAHQTSEVVLAWQGGEPTLMGLDFFRRSVAHQQKYSRPGAAQLLRDGLTGP